MKPVLYNIQCIFFLKEKLTYFLRVLKSNTQTIYDQSL